MDGVKNGDEADVDCGGSCPTKCTVGKACVAATDCSSGACTSNACVLLASCSAIKTLNASSPTGVYTIDIDGTGPLPPFDAQCDMTTDGGGWTVFQRRFNGATNFYRGWAEYVAGFGTASGEHWMGLGRLSAMTATAQVLRVNLTRNNGLSYYAQYSSFRVLGATRYELRVSGYSGTASDSLSWHNNSAFSTFDNDQDAHSGGNCAQGYVGAWWYYACHMSNLNGQYGSVSYGQGLSWVSLAGYYESMAATTMMFRPP